MHPDKQRFRYHAQVDPEMTFWLRETQWTRRASESITDDEIRRSRGGLVTYPSGEVLCHFGALRELPDGVHFMEGPCYQDGSPGFDRRRVRNGEGGVLVVHGPSRSQSGDPRHHYSTTVTNHTKHRIKATKFVFLDKRFFGIKKEPKGGYYSPVQFREWFRVQDPDGWIEPGASVCDPDNYGKGRGIWAFFFETEHGELFIATAALERRLVS